VSELGLDPRDAVFRVRLVEVVQEVLQLMSSRARYLKARRAQERFLKQNAERQLGFLRANDYDPSPQKEEVVIGGKFDLRDGHAALLVEALSRNDEDVGDRAIEVKRVFYGLGRDAELHGPENSFDLTAALRQPDNLQTD